MLRAVEVNNNRTIIIHPLIWTKQEANTEVKKKR